MNQGTSVSVFGTGALGGALTDLVHKSSDFTIRSVWNTSADKNRFYSEKGEATGLQFPENDDHLGDLVFLAVPDDVIPELARKLSEIEIDWNRRAVVHLSGSLSDVVLVPLSAKGAKTASMHPLQTFTRGDKADRFRGIWFTLQGNQDVFGILKSLISYAGARSSVMSADQKSGMHLAAVFASNYLVSLMRVVEEITEKHDIKNGLSMMEPIVNQTTRNIFSKGPLHSLSGPVSRGDTNTLRQHFSKLKPDSDHARLYANLGETAAKIAIASGQLDEENARKIRKILKSLVDGTE